MVAKRISFTAPSSAMHSSRSNLFTHCNFTGGTEIGKGGPLLAAKISPGGPILEGDQNFLYSSYSMALAKSRDSHIHDCLYRMKLLLVVGTLQPLIDSYNCAAIYPMSH